MKNKKLIKILLVVLSVMCLCSAFSSLAFAEDLEQSPIKTIIPSDLYVSLEYFESVNPSNVEFREVVTENGNIVKCYSSLRRLIEDYGEDVCFEFIYFVDNLGANDCYNYRFVSYTDSGEITYSSCFSLYDYSPLSFYTTLVDYDGVYREVRTCLDYAIYWCGQFDIFNFGDFIVGTSDSYFGIEHLCGDDCYGSSEYYLYVTHAHEGGRATCNERAVCNICGDYYGGYGEHNLYYESEEITHYSYCSDCNELISVAPSHTDIQGDFVCDECGYVMEGHIHSGGSATCTDKAKCTACGEEYGSALGHSFGNIIRKDEVHTVDKLEGGILPHYECSRCGWCFDIDLNAPLPHSIFVTPAPTHDFENFWFYDDINHWLKCDCGAIGYLGAHGGGSATCTDEAICSTCKAYYGNTLPHTDTDNNAKCDVCSVSIADHTHTYGNWITDGSYHWKECPCGDIQKSAHSGGSATCTDKAKCTACGEEYGSALGHSFGNIIRKDEVHTVDKLEGGILPHYHCINCGLCFDLDGIGPLEHWTFETPSPEHYYERFYFYDDINHWLVCKCGKIDYIESHYGGSATCTEEAICIVCGAYYGNTLPHVDTDNNAKCDVCSASIADHTHTYGNWITDGSYHWIECPCGDIQKSAHSGGSATCTAKAVCSACGVQYGNTLPHVDTDNNAKCDVCSGSMSNHKHTYIAEWKTDGYYHWKECPCGAIDEKIAHGGGRATCTDKAKCSACGVRYGSFLSHSDSDNNAICDLCNGTMTDHIHSYGELKTDGSYHWRECSCGHIVDKGAHNGGTATCTTKAVCSACGVEYGSALGHSVSDKWSTTEIDHYKYCSRCGFVLEKYYHSGGSATCTAKAVCSTCGAQYGSMLNHKDHDNNAKCDTCNTAITTHVHNYGTTYQTDGSYHWKVCSCGNIAEKSAHSGGTATCVNEAKCSVCNVRYGSLGNHNYTSATCTTLSKCIYCNERVGELRNHTDKDRNSICDDCGYLLIADTDTEQMEDFLKMDPPNKATSIKVGESLYYTLWNDDVTNLVRTYYNSLCTAPDDYYSADSYYQHYTRFTNYVDVIQGGSRVFGFEYNRVFLDDGSNPSYRYNPFTDSLYNRVEVILTFYKDGFIASEYDISAVSYSAYGDDGIVYSINGFMFNNPGTYEVTMYVNFINDFDSSFEVMSKTQIFSVELANSDIKASYDKGYADGYKIGFENGKLTDDDFSFYGFLNAIINAPSNFIDGMLDFNVFGVHMASFVKMLFTLLLVAFVVIVILKVVI